MTPNVRGPVPATGTGHSDTSRTYLEAAPPQRSATRRQAEPFAGAAWERAAGHHALGSAGRLILGQLGGRADLKGQVRATMADIAAATCLPVTKVSGVLADLANYGLIGSEGRALVLIVPPRAGDPG